MKRIVTAAVIIIGLIGTANADSKPSQRTAKANLPDCTGVSSPARIENAKIAKIDPAVAFAKRHTRTAMPASVVCESKLWQALHGNSKVAAKRSRRPSPDGQRALSGPLGSGPIHVEDSPVQAYAGAPVDLRPVVPVRTPPLRNVHPLPPPKRGDDNDGAHPEPIRPITPLEDGGPDLSTHQVAPGALVSAPTPTGLSFDGVGVGLAGFAPSSNPPDVNGRVGATQYVQWNNTSFAVFDKTTGALLYGPAAGNTLFQSLGGLCASHNDGDPVVSYDIQAGRWVLSQFVVQGPAGSFSHQCVAVSVTQDATGAYFLYDFLTDGTNFVDYPHMGVWPDGYYMSTHVFNPAGTANVAARVYVFERQKMILGQSARMQSKDLPKDGTAFQFGFLPADLESLTPPPAGAQEYVIGPNAQLTNQTDISRVAVTWGVTPTMTLTSTVNLTVGLGNAPCVSNTGGQLHRDCVPQPSPAVATDDLDNLGRHYMHRLAYRNNGGTESIMATGITAGATTTPAHGAIKWMEWRGAAGSGAPTLFQSGTYDPTPTTSEYRWMPSIAMDKAGNVALGYSKSSPSVIPGIYMSGRLSTDTAGTMGAETTVQAGIGVQTSGAGSRWGDYSSMTLDPVDQCTFWYTNEYLKTNGAFNWSTRIASYKFPSCTPDTSWGTLTGTITSCATGVPLSGVVVNLSNGFAGTTDAAGHYSITVPNGTYTATASDTARACTDGSPATVDVTVPANGNTSQNFCMTGASNLQFNAVTIDDATNGNNNGIINSNECVNLNVALKNNGCANESAISSTLTTATAGVTITQGSSAYPNIAIDASSNNTTPFKIQTSNSFVCGTTINLTLNLTYASGSKSIGLSVPTCAGGANQSIPTSSIALADLSQPDRLGRDGNPSTCAGKACPGAINTAGTRNYKKFTFTNSGGAVACMTVQINAACGSADIESAAYLNSYTPPTAQGDAAGNLCLGYLGDSGISGLGTTVPSSSYSFQVPASSNFVIVVSTATGSTTCTTFSGVVSGFFDFTPGPGACSTCTPPATPAASNSGPYCAGATIALSTPTVAGATYTWTGPNGFTSSLQNPTRANATTADAGTYSVTVTVAGCTSAAGTTSVVVNSTATPTASNGGPYCSGATISLSTPTVASATYAWTGPNGFTSALQNPTRANATTADAGTYSVTVTVSGCTSAAGTTSVVVNPIPATPAASNTGPYCSGATISLSTPTVASATYAWTGPNSFTSSQQNPTRANATVADAGSYSVTVTVGGCTSAAGSTNVAVNAAPATPTITPGGPTTFCAGGSVTLTSSSASGNQWFLNAGLITGATGNTYSATGTGNYTVVVTASGCSSAPSAATTVTVNPIPATPTINAGGSTTFCEGGSVTLTSSSATGNQWYRNGVPLGSETSQTTVATLAGAYSVTTTASGCTSAASAATTVTVNPKPNVTISVPSPMYSGASGTASVVHECTGATFSWSITGGTITSGNGTRSITFTAGGAGTLTLFVTVTNSFGCSDSKSADVTVQLAPFGAPPYLGATATGTTGANLIWAAVASADHYEIYRSTDNTNWTLRGTNTLTTFSESGLTPSTTYLYKVRAIKADTTASGYSAIDPATTIVFTDPSLTACPTLIRPLHITELRAAINAARASVGQTAFTFTDPSLGAGAKIKAVHVTELRTALAPVLSAIAVTPSYTDPTIVAGTTVVKATHIQELRDLVR
jgi:hypothetical protein